MASNAVAIFWDYENCALPALEPSYTIVNKIRRLAHQYGSVKSFKAYLECPEQLSLKTVALRSELQSCGVSLIDCPHNGRKDVADKMMMVDMMAHAIDTPAPSTIMLISGDRDFVYAVSILCLRQYRVVLLAPRAAHGSLKAQADAVYNWPEDFLPELPLDIVEPAATATATHLRRPSTGRSGPASPDDFWIRPCGSPPSATFTAASSEPTLVGISERTDDVRCSGDGSPAEVTPESGSDSGGGDGESFPGVLKKADSESLSDAGLSLAAESAGSSVKQSEWGDPHKTSSPVMTWATVAQLPKSPDLCGRSPSFAAPPRPFVPEAQDLFGPDAIVPPRRALPIHQPLNAHAPPFVLSPTFSPRALDPTDPTAAIDGADWQTYSRAAKRRCVPVLPGEFKPLVKVLKRQLAEGVVQVESSQLGQFLSQEVPRLGTIYERAGVVRLKEYTTLAAEQGIVTLTREGADGHNYVALHPAYRRKAATLA